MKRRLRLRWYEPASGKSGLGDVMTRAQFGRHVDIMHRRFQTEELPCDLWLRYSLEVVDGPPCPGCGGDQDPCPTCAAWARLSCELTDALDLIHRYDLGTLHARLERPEGTRELVELGLVDVHPNGGRALTPLGAKVLQAARGAA